MDKIGSKTYIYRYATKNAHFEKIMKWTKIVDYVYIIHIPQKMSILKNTA